MALAVCQECGTQYNRKQYQKRCNDCRNFNCTNCGNTFLITPVQWWHYKKGITKALFCSNKCKNSYFAEHNPTKGMPSPNRYPIGSKRIKSDGYILVKIKNTSYQWNDWVPEHRYILEQHLGRPLMRNELIHHIDQNRQNNSLDNLQIVNASEHAGECHQLGRIRKRNSLGQFIR